MTHSGSPQALVRIAALAVALALPLPAMAAVSSWNPTLLVNTESFQTIDSGGGGDRELRFGNTTTEKLIYDVTNARFTFTRDLRIQGNVTATGALVVKKAISGASLVIDGNASFAHSGVIITPVGETKLEVVGTLSGSTVFGTNSLRSSGSLVWEGQASGAALYIGGTFEGAGLSSCNGALQKLLWNATTKRFECGVDDSGSAFTQNAADERYVRTAGDTMTGALTIDVAGEGTTALSVSGAFIFNDSGLNNDARFEGDTDANLVFVDASTDRVGIGTATPKSKLDVVGTLSGAALRVSGAAEIHGPLAVTGAIRTDSDLTINDDQTAADAILTFGQPSTNETLTFSNSNGRFEFSDDVHATGNISADGNFTINADQTAANAVLTFGSDGTNETITFANTADRFEVSDDFSVLGALSGSSLWVDGNATVRGSLAASGAIRTEGNLSGSTLTVDGALTLRGQTYNAPTSQTANGFLKTDGNGNLSWTTSLGSSSGNLLSLHPEYPGAVYFQSGSTYVGQLTLSGGTTGLENSYEWTSTQATTQDYWISVRFRIPDNFSSWDVVAPIQFRYKTGVASSANNHLTVRLRDTAGSFVTLTGGSTLANTSWTTATITGPQSSGTWTPKGYATVYVKLAANSTAGANAAAGFLNLNFETTAP